MAFQISNSTDKPNCYLWWNNRNRLIDYRFLIFLIKKCKQKIIIIIIFRFLYVKRLNIDADRCPASLFHGLRVEKRCYNVIILKK